MTIRAAVLAFGAVLTCTWVLGAERSKPVEEDPSYEPQVPVKAAPPPPRATRFFETSPSAPTTSRARSGTSAPAQAAKQPVPNTGTDIMPAPVAAEVQPTGPRVKYILDGKPVYEGEPDPIADKKVISANEDYTVSAIMARKDGGKSPQRAAEPQPLQAPPLPPPVVEQQRNALRPASKVRVEPAAVTPEAAYVPRGGEYAQAPLAPGERRVKYILNGKPVYEGDPDPIADKNPAPSGDYTVPAIMARQQNGTVAPAARTQASILSDDLTADRPNAAAATANGPLVLEEMAASGPVNSRAKKAFAQIGELKKELEAISRYMDNRGKENARLVHASDEVLNHINDLAAVWPAAGAFRDVCATAKRSALIFNNELNQTPWEWNKVRWSYGSVLADIRTLRSLAKDMADAEPKPVPMVGKNGQVFYVDAPEPGMDAATVQRDARVKATKDELARLKNVERARDENKKNGGLDFDLDGTKLKN